MTIPSRAPRSSGLASHTDRELLVKMLAEMRVQTLLMAHAFSITDDISALRDEVMAQGNQSVSDV